MTVVLKMMVEKRKGLIRVFSFFHALGDLKEKRYFFGTTKRSGTVHESKCKRAAGRSGYWKPIGKYKQILASKSNQALGIRRTLIFCEGKRSYGTKTRWVMHEFRLLDSETNLGSTQVYIGSTS